jgi:DNA-binding LytR/AlgR family response regulator
MSLLEAGQVHRVPTDDIVSISGADDYIEVKLKSGKSRLISSTLAEMEASLPSFFLRVHRSHIVNTNYIESLNREPTGTGILTLAHGGSLPVSRRIMPSVRKALV